MRTACYIDGFNLYHAVEALGDPTLKWTNLAGLARSYMREGDHLVRTVFFYRAEHLGRGKTKAPPQLR